jgi:hypothetical protein
MPDAQTNILLVQARIVLDIGVRWMAVPSALVPPAASHEIRSYFCNIACRASSSSDLAG